MNNDKFDKFTERARMVLSLAREEALGFNHNYIGTEHLLLGLVREGEDVAAKVLRNFNVELDRVRSAVEFIIGRGDVIVFGEIGFTPRVKKVIELAVDEARRLNDHYIGTQHLLLGLVREGDGIAAGVLESLGVNLEKVRAETIKVLSQSGNPPVESVRINQPSDPRAGAPQQVNQSPPPRRIFISYRRHDSADAAGRIDDHLVAVFGREHVFKDTDSIPLGKDFRAYLDDKITRSDAVLVIIGNGWLSASEQGVRRIDADDDYVRYEIEQALQLQKPIIPVTVQGARVPRKADLPSSIRDLVYRQGLEIRSDSHFHQDVQFLIERMKAMFDDSASQ